MNFLKKRTIFSEVLRTSLVVVIVGILTWGISFAADTVIAQKILGTQDTSREQIQTISARGQISTITDFEVFIFNANNQVGETGYSYSVDITNAHIKSYTGETLSYVDLKTNQKIIAKGLFINNNSIIAHTVIIFGDLPLLEDIATSTDECIISTNDTASSTDEFATSTANCILTDDTASTTDEFATSTDELATSTEDITSPTNSIIDTITDTVGEVFDTVTDVIGSVIETITGTSTDETILPEEERTTSTQDIDSNETSQTTEGVIEDDATVVEVPATPLEETGEPEETLTDTNIESSEENVEASALEESIQETEQESAPEPETEPAPEPTNTEPQ